MSHGTFKQIKGTEDISADFISRIRCMCHHDTLDTKEEGKQFGHFIFEELPPFNETKRVKNNCESNMTCTHKTRLGRDNKIAARGPLILQSDPKHENNK